MNSKLSLLTVVSFHHALEHLLALGQFALELGLPLRHNVVRIGTMATKLTVLLHR